MVVSETWYLDAIEWRRFREELRQARAAYERIDELVKDHRRLRNRRFARNYSMHWVKTYKDKLKLKTTDIDRYFEDIAKVAPCIEFDLAYEEWKMQRNEFFQRAKDVERLLDVKRTKQVIRDKKFVRLQRVKKEAETFHKLMLRLEAREKILNQAIQAGLFLTTAEQESLESMSNGKLFAIVRSLSSEVA